VRILLPLDGSPASEQAVKTVAAMCATNPCSTVEVLQVLDPMAAAGALHLLWQESSATEYLARHAQALQERGVNATSDVDFGVPAKQIVRRAVEGEFDCVCMATRGRSGFARAILGSVTDRVVRHSPVPVVVVKAAGR